MQAPWRFFYVGGMKLFVIVVAEFKVEVRQFPFQLFHGAYNTSEDSFPLCNWNRSGETTFFFLYCQYLSVLSLLNGCIGLNVPAEKRI